MAKGIDSEQQVFSATFWSGWQFKGLRNLCITLFIGLNVQQWRDIFSPNGVVASTVPAGANCQTLTNLLFW